MADHSNTTTTILVVDDAKENIQLLSHVLQKEGYDIIKAFSGEEALASVNQHAPDIMLLDVMMPDLNGFEVCRRIKNQPATEDIPIIFLSALSEIDSKVEGFKAGGVDYITKPFQREEVLARIDLHVRLKKLQNQLQEKIEALKEREQRLNALNKRKDDLMRILSHDIRNPVTGIIGVAQLLSSSAEGMTPEDRKMMYDSIEESGRKILDLVKELLSKDTTEKNISELNTQRVNLKSLIKEVIDLHQPTALTKRISFEMNLGSSIDMKLDRQKMNQVLGNLVSNALKFTDEGGTVSIGLEECDLEEEIKITVSDNGVGIAKEELPELLSNGEKNIHPGTKGEQGSGIGLDIIKHFTKLHGGKVSVYSELDKGTTFTIILPKIN